MKKKFLFPIGTKLLAGLSMNDLFVSSACGGGGTCGQCRVKVYSGGGAILPTETAYVTPREAREGDRLSCQVAVKRDMEIELPVEVFGCRQWQCVVRSNHNVSTFIKNLVLELPPGEEVNFRAGGYIQIECPPCHIKFSDFIIEPEYQGSWDKFNLWQYSMNTDEPISRAYSMANYPEEKGIIMLNVRIATPPPSKENNIPPGIMSSYMFNLKPGDKVTISGPFGEFYAHDTDREMIFIAAVLEWPRCVHISLIRCCDYTQSARSVSGTVHAVYVSYFLLRILIICSRILTTLTGMSRFQNLNPMMTGKVTQVIFTKFCIRITWPITQRRRTANTISADHRL